MYILVARILPILVFVLRFARQQSPHQQGRSSQKTCKPVDEQFHADPASS